MVLTFTNSMPDLRKGSIITVDLDTMGYLRRVTELKIEGNRITLQTEQAYLNDVFVTKDFKLNSDLIEPNQFISKKSIPGDISKALTDKSGFIHPVKIIFQDSKGVYTEKSVFEMSLEQKDARKIINFYRDFSNTDLYGRQGDNVHFYISEGHVSVLSNLVCEFDWDYNGTLDEDTKVKKGDLKTFSFYLQNTADFLAKLNLDMTKSYNKDDNKKLVNFNKVTAQFVVGVVPVWVSVDCDVWGGYDFNTTGSLNANWGFESDHTLKIGGTYDRLADTYTPIKEYTPNNIIYPLNINAEIDADAHLEIYPHADIMFYGFFGPYAEIVPYVNGNYNSSLISKVTTTGNSTFLAWNSDLNIGLDFRLGLKLSFLGLFDRNIAEKTINCFELPIWYSPSKVELLSSLPSQIQLNNTVQLNFIVMDNLNNPVNLCPIYFTGNGIFDKELGITDLQGKIDVNWTVNDSPGEKFFSASIFNGNGTIIDELNEEVTVVSDGASTGKIVGIVRDASTMIPLPDVIVNVLLSGESQTNSFTQIDGYYEINIAGNTGYTVIFSKPGYLDVQYHNVNVTSGVNTVLEPVLQIDQNYSGYGVISGTVKNAIDGTGISNVILNLRSGINATSGNIIASTIADNDGIYVFSDVMAGNYTIEAINSNFNTSYVTVICLGGLIKDHQDVTMSPNITIGQIRIVLTWGEYPFDLDSHFTGPLLDGTRFHMYYFYVNSNGNNPWPEIVNLDIDDVYSYGPETTTLLQQIDGIYRFSVHDYTNRNLITSYELSNSSAQVKVYNYSGLVATFNVPPNTEGTLWTVFEMNNGTITPINQMSYESNPDNVTKGNYINPEIYLFRNLPKK